MAIPYSRTIAGTLPWYSVLVVTGIALAVWLAGKEEKRLAFPADTMVDLALLVVPLGILGARIYYVLMSWEQFAHRPLSALFIWQGGLAIYGGVIGGLVGAIFYARRKKIDLLRLLDALAPGVLLAQAIGRWGNYFNMEAYGPLITDASLHFFPYGVQIPSASGYSWHMATFFYESVWNFAGFAVLWAMRKCQKQNGDTFFRYLLIYGSGRFVIEQLRQDSLYIGPFRASQWLSLLLCIVAAVILLRHAMLYTREFSFGTGCVFLWLLRWAFLQQPMAYALVLLAAGMMAIWLLRKSGSLVWLMIMIGLDVLGLTAAINDFPAGTLIHSLVCSMTLVGQVLLLCMREE